MRRQLLVAVSIVLLLAIALFAKLSPVVPSAQAISATVVISQIQVAGGTAADEFVELHNISNAPFDLNGHRLVYRASTATTDNTDLASWTTSTIIPAGGFYLVAATPGYDDTVTADKTFTDGGSGRFAGGTGGGIALRNGAVNTGTIVDSVGYGNATNAFVETTATALPGANNSRARKNNGCEETDNNSNDFEGLTPSAPRNSSTVIVCGGGGGGTPTLTINNVTLNEGNGGPTIFTFTVSLSSAAGVGGVTYNIATQDNTATTADSDYNAINLTGESIAEGQTSKNYNITVNGDTTAEPNESFFVNVTAITGATPTTRQATGNIVNDDGVAITPISTIQGSSTASPFVGSTLTTIGIVTLKKSNGFFIQTPTASVDSDPNTSEGLWVLRTAAPVVSVGDSVTVNGTVGEFFNLTELNATSGSVVINSTGNSLPAAIALTPAILSPTGGVTQLEKYESMRLSAASLTTVSPTDNFFDAFVVLTGTPRPMREQGIEISKTVPPGTPCCVPRFDENPEKFSVDTDGRLGSTGLNLTSFVTITSVTGVLDFTFSEYRLIPEAALTVTPNISAIPVPTLAAGEFTIGSFNIENFANATTQRQKASLAIRNVMRSPDIIGVAEIFELSGLQALATQINNDAVAAGDPNPGYTAHLLEANDTTGDNDQDVGFLVKTSRVQFISIEQFYKGKTWVFAGVTDVLHDRPPLVLHATVDPSGANPVPVTVMVNHTKSLIEVDQDPGAGPRNREKRRLQAEDVALLAQSLQNENLVLVGDYNAFQFSDGLVDVIGTIMGTPTPADQVVLASPDLVNPDLYDLINDLPRTERYSYVFGGDAQVLDHVMVNPKMRRRQTRYAIAHNDADFPESLAADASRPERASDHDMPVAYFILATPTRHATAADFSGDRKTDASIFRSSDGLWSFINSIDGVLRTQALGTAGDKPVPGDYDGDNKTDVAVWRPSNGTWYIINSSGGALNSYSWGMTGDIPVPGDYDGDFKTDIAVWRPSEGNWYIIRSSGGGTVQGWGNPSDVPVPADYDGDGKTDIAVWRPSEGHWYIINSATNSGIVLGWGLGSLGDKLVPADYDGDGKTDLAIFRPSENNWYIRNSGGGSTVRSWGNAGDKLVPGDYDGDGKADIAVYRPSTEDWYVIKSSDGASFILNTGGFGDTPIPSVLIPQ